MFKYWIDKFKKEKTRLFAKISDKIFKTTKFDDYQRKYANYYQNNYSLTVGQYSFVHIPKTAGSFLHTWLQKNSTNFYNAAHNAVSLKCDPKKYNYITTLRDPSQRVYSYYLMQKNNVKLSYYNHANVNLDFFLQKSWSSRNGICKFINGYINKELNDELYQISLNNLKNFYFVCDFDNIQNDFIELKRKLGIKKEFNFIENNKISKREISIKENQLIEKYNYFDLKLYNYFKNHLI